MVVYRDRAWSGIGTPVNNDGRTPRPLLAPKRTIITAHYPGLPVGRSYAGWFASDADKINYLHAVQRNAIAQGKSFEYSFLIFMDGVILEYAGDHLAAHSSGENAISYGVQFVNGQHDLGTDAQVNAYRWLRDVHLYPRDRVTADAVTTPHRHMPLAATSCPGDYSIMPILDDLRLPYVPPPIDPDPDNEGDMYRILILTDAGGAAVLLHGFTARWLDPTRYNRYHYYMPITDEPATRAWLQDLTFFGPLPPGVVATDCWAHQPDG